MKISEAKEMYLNSKCGMQRFYNTYGDRITNDFYNLNIPNDTLEEWKKEYIDIKWKELERAKINDIVQIISDISDVIELRQDVKDIDYIKKYIEKYSFINSLSFINILIGSNIYARRGLILHFLDLGDKKTAIELLNYVEDITTSKFEKLNNDILSLKKEINSK